VPPSPPPPPPSVPRPAAPEKNFNHQKCLAYWGDPTHRFHQLWGPEGWKVRRNNGWACWGDRQQGWKYFDDTWWGRPCERNWYTGNEGQLGEPNGGPAHKWVWPHFTKRQAPALLGFDESIDNYCARHGGQGQHAVACVQANVNILSLYGNRIPCAPPRIERVGSPPSACVSPVALARTCRDRAVS
jgi:hypothetical protein